MSDKVDSQLIFFWLHCCQPSNLFLSIIEWIQYDIHITCFHEIGLIGQISHYQKQASPKMWLYVANASWLDSVIFMLLFICSICISCSRQVLLFQVNNILIVNLAISDLFLCTIVSPLTLIELLYKRWTGPKAPWLCCLSGMGPACITFVSTLTITGIAIDRWDIFWPILLQGLPFWAKSWFRRKKYILFSKCFTSFTEYFSVF